MDNHMLSQILREDPYTSSYFRGVYAADTMPTMRPKEHSCYVINTDAHDEPGQHWVCIFSESGTVEYFDSYGRPVTTIAPVARFLRNIRVSSNQQQLQSLYSDVCGHYVLYYLFHRCRGHSMQSIVNRFTDDVHRNDRDVDHFITRHISIRNN